MLLGAAGLGAKRLELALRLRPATQAVERQPVQLADRRGAGGLLGERSQQPPRLVVALATEGVRGVAQPGLEAGHASGADGRAQLVVGAETLAGDATGPAPGTRRTGRLPLGRGPPPRPAGRARSATAIDGACGLVAQLALVDPLLGLPVAAGRRVGTALALGPGVRAGGSPGVGRATALECPPGAATGEAAPAARARRRGVGAAGTATAVVARATSVLVATTPAVAALATAPAVATLTVATAPAVDPAARARRRGVGAGTATAVARAASRSVVAVSLAAVATIPAAATGVPAGPTPGARRATRLTTWHPSSTSWPIRSPGPAAVGHLRTAASGGGPTPGAWYTAVGPPAIAGAPAGGRPARRTPRSAAPVRPLGARGAAGPPSSRATWAVAAASPVVARPLAPLPGPLGPPSCVPLPTTTPTVAALVVTGPTGARASVGGTPLPPATARAAGARRARAGRPASGRATTPGARVAAAVAAGVSGERHGDRSY